MPLEIKEEAYSAILQFHCTPSMQVRLEKMVEDHNKLHNTNLTISKVLRHIVEEFLANLNY